MKKLLLLLLLLPAAAQELSKPERDAREILNELLEREPAENSEMLGTFKIRDAKGQRREIPLRYTVKRGDKEWRGIYETQPAAAIPAQQLIVLHHPGSTNQYLLGSNGAKPTPVRAKEVWQAFASTDFWAGDLGLEFLHWPSQTLVKHEMRKGRSCRVIESRNPDKDAKGYARVLSWIDFETGGLIRAEGYDAANKLLKEFSIRGFKKVNGHWELKEMEILNEQTDSRTRLEFNLELK